MQHPRRPPSLHDLLVLSEGNATMRSTLYLIRTFQRHEVPLILDNPQSSFMWRVPELVRMARIASVQGWSMDFCSLGCAYRKRTFFLGCHLDPLDVQRLAANAQHRCIGHSVCSFTGRPHEQLTGHDEYGVAKTKRAQQYPWKLAHMLADLLVSKALGDRQLHSCHSLSGAGVERYCMH